MTQRAQNFNTQRQGVFASTAPLTNVSLCSKAMLRAVDRPYHLPGFVCFYGPAGWGKSTAAAYVANAQEAYYIQCQETWTRKAVLLAILEQMGIDPKKTLYEMSRQVCQQLASSRRPLIIDELDHLVKRCAVEMIRDIHEGSGAAILLIGEERLPDKLQRWERFHSRVLDWVPAQPADLDDCRYLSQLYCREVEIADDLLAAIHSATSGNTRYVVVNIELVRVTALELGMSEFNRQDWGARPFHTGKAPERRFLR